MFHGSIPADMRTIIVEQARTWDVESVYVGCSGNLTIERALHALRKFKLHGNDVTVYSCLLGQHFATRDVALRVVPEHQHQWGWLEQYTDCGDSASALAVVMLCTRMFLGGDGAYYDRMREAYRTQWAKLHEKTKAKIDAMTLELASFTQGDVVEWMEAAPDDQAAVCFPPFYAGDYEAMFQRIQDTFDWEPPEYGDLVDERRERLIAAIQAKRHWLIGLHVRDEAMDEAGLLLGRVQTTNRGIPIHLYGNGETRRLVVPHQPVEAVSTPRLEENEEVGERISLAVLTDGQFSALRSEYMNRNIKPGQASLAVAVLVDRKLVGVFAYSVAPTMASWSKHLPQPTAYLLSDFPIAPTRYTRLAKLVLYAALSHEARQLVERSGHRRYCSAVTTAFSQRPSSMKYRGLFRVLNRKEQKPPKNPDDPVESYYGQKYQINYGTELGRWSLAEGLAEWKKKHGARDV